MILALITLLGAYLIGAIPFGYLIARSRGVNIFEKGSGNIGATNVGRVLGRKLGLLVFALDLLKGMAPVFVAGKMPVDVQGALGLPDSLRVGCAALAFVGHIFPVFLKFRGGKGVATGAGTMFMLAPLPMAIAFASFLALMASTRTISIGSIGGVIVLCFARFLSVDAPFASDHLAVTLFCLVGSTLLVVKHRSNIRRLVNGNENKLESTAMLATIARSIHVLAVGLWFGAAVMFNFIAAPAIFESFKEVVAHAPSDRTANLDIAANTTESQKADLASALAGSAVGPIFPRFFALQAVCAALALFTAYGWRTCGKIHRIRFYIIVLAALTVAVGWPISMKVSQLRLDRLANPDLRQDFVIWHLISLALSIVTAILATVATTIAGQMPTTPHQSPPKA